MADNEHEAGDEGETHRPEDPDGFNDLVEKMEDKFRDEDAGGDEDAGEKDDDDDDDDAGEDADDEQDEENDDADDDDDSDDEDSESEDTDDDRDGDADDSDADSDDDDDEDSDDESDSKDGDADGDDKGDEKDEDKDDDEDSTERRLEAAGADLKLEDVPEKYRGIIQKKIQGIDRAFTRVQQESTAFRQERERFYADEKFRKENPAAFIVEQLRSNPKLMVEINKQLDEIEDTDEGKKSEKGKKFDDEVKQKRKAAADAVKKDFADAATEFDKAVERGQNVDAMARKLADKQGVPYRFVEKAIIALINERRTAGQKADVTDDEVREIVKVEAKEWKRETRQRTRDDSKRQVRDRTEARKKGSPAARTPSSAQTPRPGKKKEEKLNHDDEEARLARMDRSAKRILSQVK